MQTAPSHPQAASAAPDAGADGGSLLRMSVGDQPLAVPIDRVREILQVMRMTPLPRTPAFVRGVMNLRGSVVPVIDLAARLGLPPTEIGRRACIVVVHIEDDPESETASPAGTAMGLLVDAVFEVFDHASGDIEPAPLMGTDIAPEHLLGITRAGGRLIGVLNLDRALAASDLVAAIAGFQPH